MNNSRQYSNSPHWSVSQAFNQVVCFRCFLYSQFNVNVSICMLKFNMKIHYQVPLKILLAQKSFIYCKQLIHSLHQKKEQRLSTCASYRKIGVLLVKHQDRKEISKRTLSSSLAKLLWEKYCMISKRRGNHYLRKGKANGQTKEVDGQAA